MKTQIIYPPKIQAMMTGAMVCERGPVNTVLIYTDGSKESVKSDALPNTINWEDWFSIVSGIQSLRKP